MKVKYFLFILTSLMFFACSDKDDIKIDNPDDTIVIEDSTPSAPIASQGFYVVNEDWFGHDKGTVNYFKNDGSIVYRAYRATNANETLGVTTCFATIYGENMYFVSKQGSRLVIADAVTLKKKAEFTNIGGDGRAFLGINTEKAYIGTSEGITILDIKTLSTNATLAGISGQVGNMCLIGDKAFAVVQSKGVYVINSNDNTIETLIDGSFSCITQSKDGSIWIGANDKLISLNPYTLKSEEIDISQSPIRSSWGAWNSGSLCASTQENVLYWVNGSSVVKYDINTKNLTETFYTLGTDSEDKQLSFYGAALRVDPLTNKLMLIVKRRGWGDNGSYNWIHVVNSNGVLEKSITVNGDNGLGSEWGTGDGRYFWFPAMPFYEDVNKPEILVNQIILKQNERKAICLSDKIVDADNMATSIIKNIVYDGSDLAEIQLKQDSLIITSSSKTGKTEFTLKVNSNGKLQQKQVRIDIR